MEMVKFALEIYGSFVSEALNCWQLVPDLSIGFFVDRNY
jgi:hypothetical protein